MELKHTLTLLLLLGCLVGGYFLMRTLMSDEVETVFSVYGKGYTEDNVVGMEVVTPGSSLSFTFREGHYWLLNKKSGTYSIPTRREQIRTFLNGITAARKIDSIERGERNPAEWRLADQATVLTLAYTDGTSRILRIGSDNPAGRGVFCLFEDEPGTIYLLSAQVRFAAEAILWQAVEDRILLARTEDILGFEIQAEATEELRANQVNCIRREGEWFITEPRELKADSRAVLGYLDLITGLRFESIEDRLAEIIAERTPILNLEARLTSGETEALVIYPGAKDMMSQPRHILHNTRTGLIGYVYMPVFESINRSFVSFVWRRLFQGDPRKITAIQFERGDQNVSFNRKENGDWVIIEAFNALADKRQMEFVLGALMNFRVIDFVSDEVKDISAMGLKHPKAVLKIIEFNDEKTTEYCYYFGDQVEGKNQIYFKEINSNDIYTVDYSFVSLLSRPARAFVGQTITNCDPQLIDRIRIMHRDKAYKFYWSEIEGWFLKEPLLTRHIDNDLFQRLLKELSNIKYAQIPMPESVPLEAFDEGHTVFRLEVHVKSPSQVDPDKNFIPEPEKDYFFTFSDMKDRSGNVYVHQQFKNLVFTIQPEIVELLMSEFVDRSVFTADIGSASQMEISWSHQETSIVLVQKNNEWSHKDSPESRTDARAIIAWLGYLNSLKAESVFVYRTEQPERDKLGFDNPVFEVNVTTGGGEDYSIRLGRIFDENGSGLISRDNEVYLLKISADQINRLYVQPEYFLLPE